tara:strand:- start:340 stop:804 length:465 start_codon:yes stop_codon:yes gene_type:complete
MNKWVGKNVICIKEGDNVIKIFNNTQSYQNELKWIKILPDEISPTLISFNDEKKEIIESYCGLRYPADPLRQKKIRKSEGENNDFISKLPDDYLDQLNYIKKIMKKHGCNGRDIEIVCDEVGKIKIIDFSAFGNGAFSWGKYKKLANNKKKRKK